MAKLDQYWQYVQAVLRRWFPRERLQIYGPALGLALLSFAIA